MDEREAMAMSDQPSYYTHPAIGGLNSGAISHPILNANPNPTDPVNSSTITSEFHIESPLSIAPAAGGGEPLKKKRGRPRKYGTDESVALALSPLSATPGSGSGSDRVGGSQKRGRGRPPGTGKKQQLGFLGEWVLGSAGMGFTPHIIMISEGEDIAAKIMSFSQQGQRAICILSANGAVSTVTLRQSSISGGTITYQGRFEILCLSGSYLVNDDSGGSHSRSGGLSISLSNPDGSVIGGGVGGSLIAASPIQVIVGSFIFGASKSKSRTKTDQESAADLELSTAEDNHMISPCDSLPNQGYTPLAGMGGWPQVDMHNPDIDIDLTRE